MVVFFLFNNANVKQVIVIDQGKLEKPPNTDIKKKSIRNQCQVRQLEL